jgi:hypothetical protein
MGLGRAEQCLTLLPTGEVLATGGIGEPEDFDPDPLNDKPRTRPELWDPTVRLGDGVGAWYGAGAGTLLAEQAVTRAHHSTAMLLPDGRVLTGGGYDTHPDRVRRAVDQYSPPCLFAPGAAPDTVARPRLQGAQDRIAYGRPFEVACPDAVVAACLIRPGASTHAFNHDNRYVPLAIPPERPQDGHRVTLLAPPDANVAPPGNYLLFVLRDEGGRKVPSVARWVSVGNVQTSHATWDTLAPAAIHDLMVLESTDSSHTLQWTAPADAGIGSHGRAARYELRYRSGAEMRTLEDFLAHGTPVADVPEPAEPGTLQVFTVRHPPTGRRHHFRILSRDGAGSDRNWSALSNDAETRVRGCPFVDTRTAEGWLVENSILGRSPTGALALDAYRLRFAPGVAGDRVRLRIRENEQERTTLDQARLVAVDHAPGLRAWPLGEAVVVGTRVPAARVTTARGSDVTALVNGAGEGYSGGPGDTLLVEFAPGAPEGDAPLVLEDGGKCPPDCAYPILGGDDARPGAEFDAAVLAASGIRLERPDGAGGWVAVATRYPREHADEVVFEDPGPGPVRLVFVGRHRVWFVGRIRRAGPPLAAPELPLVEARHARFGDVMAEARTAGAGTVELVPGDTLELAFGWTPPPAGQARELFLLTRGSYTSKLPTGPGPVGPEHFALHVPRPNPFATSTVLRFDLPREVPVRLEVLDAQGRRVRILVDRALPAGPHAFEWDGRNETGDRSRPGVYFIRLEAGGFRARGRIAYLP